MPSQVRAGAQDASRRPAGGTSRRRDVIAADAVYDALDMALRVAERAEIEAVRSVFEAGADRGLDVTAEEVRGVLCSATRLLPWDVSVNRALGLGLVSSATDDDVDAVLDFYRRQGTSCAIAVAPRAEPHDLERRLKGRGFTKADVYALFSTRPRPMERPRSRLRVERVPAGAGAEFAKIVVDAYKLPVSVREWIEAITGAPGWTCYVTYAADEPAGVGALYVAGELGWLAYAGTLPEHRRRGSQSLLFAARIEDALRSGVRTVATAATLSPDGRPTSAYRNIVRSGMKLLYKGSNFVIDAVE